MRMRFLYSTIALLSFANWVSGDVLACATGCQIPMPSLLFLGDSPDQDYYVAECQNTLRVQSTFLCMRTHCSQKEINKGLAYFDKDTCQTYGKVSLLPWSIIDNITKADEDAFPVVGLDNLTTSTSASGAPTIYETPVLLDDVLFQYAYNTAYQWNESEISRANYSYAMYGFWGIVCFIGLFNRLSVFLMNQRESRQSKEILPNDKSRPPFASIKLWIRKKFVTPALFSYHAAQPIGWCTIPARLESITLFAFLIVNIVLCCVSYDAFEGNLYWSRKDTQLWRYVADRTGCISMANMVLMWTFAMRNNVLLWVTGWSFTTFNQFHRWISRIATVEAVVHSVAYTVMVFQEGGKAELVMEWAERYWWMGAIATIVMCLICGVSIYGLRRHFYEIFLIVHILFAALFLLSMYYHVEIFEGEYNGYIWACVAVWAFDRVLRLARVLFITTSSAKAVAMYNKDSNLIRLEVPVRASIKPGPGSYFYVYVFNRFTPWESHPFTVCSWTESSSNIKSQAPTKSVSFHIRPYAGFTSKLRNLILQKADTESNETIVSAPLRVFIEGPYGPAHNIQSHGSALFVIGGSGITVALAHIRTLCDAIQSGRQLRTKRVHLVWAVRDRAMFDDVFERDISSTWFGEDGLASKMEVQVDLFVTRDSGRKASVISEVPLRDNEEPAVVEIGVDQSAVAVVKEQSVAGAVNAKTSSISSEIEDSIDLSRKVIVHHGRPDVHEIIIQNGLRYGTAGGKIAVVCCGPHSMADDGRAGVVAALDKGCDGLDFYPELFNW